MRVDAVEKVIDTNPEFGFRVFINSMYVVNTKKKMDPDYFLIETIRDQKDAQVVGPVIDKTSKRRYNAKVQEFY